MKALSIYACIWKKQAEQYWAWFLRYHLWPLFVFLAFKFVQGIWVVFWPGRISCINIWIPSQASTSSVFVIKNCQLIRRTKMKSKLVMARVKWRLCCCVFFKIRFWSCSYRTVSLWSEKYFALKKNETSRDVPKSTWNESCSYAR